MRLFAFDLETTGLDQQNDRIMEFCFIELGPDMQPVGEPYTALVNPERPIPAKIQEITSITDGMVADKKPFAHHAPRIQKLVEGATLIAHNHRFDVPFLHNELVRAGQAGMPVDQPCVDTAGIERIVNSHRLEATYERYTGSKMDGAHRSQADTEATIEVLRQQMAKNKEILGDDPMALTAPRLAKLRDPDAEVRTWLDHGHKFYQDEKGVARFGFGKHRDEPVAKHEGFLNWMTSRDFPADTKECVQQFLKEMRGPQERLALILCVGQNYAKHVSEMGSTRPAEPLWFWKPPSAIIGDAETVVVPEGIGEVHHEVELAVRVRRAARNVSVEEALKHLDAYTVAVDVTARALQTAAKKAGKPWAQAKGFDTFLPLGEPHKIDRDMQDMPLELRIDGDVRQAGSTSGMTWTVAELVSLASQWTTLRPGQWLLTGTPEGVGPIAPGQTMEARVGDARMRNPVGP